jgi:16S rRNA (guanine527-N7)-methyltransferase
MNRDDRLERWIAALVATPGLTAIDDPEIARRDLVEDSLRAVPVLEQLEGPIVDVGSGGGVPGIPLAAVLPEREFILLESNRRKADFLEEQTAAFPNVSVLRGRAEEQPKETYGVALAKALAPPPVAAEWCLPLVRVGGAAVLWVGPTVDTAAVERAAAQLGGGPVEDREGLLVLAKVEPTPAGFPRRPGIARKRPLG